MTFGWVDALFEKKVSSSGGAEIWDTINGEEVLQK